jgi:CHAT domain-containing protein
MMKKLSQCLLVFLTILISNAGTAQNVLQLLKDVESDAVMTPEQEKLEVVNTLTNVGNGNYVYHVVRESGKSLQGLVQSDNGEMKVRIPMQYQFIDEISNADYKDSISQYVYVYQDLTHHYAYDLVNDKMIKLNLKGQELNLYHQYKRYIGKSSCGELFDLCGTYCGETISPFYNPGAFELNQENGRFMYVESWGNRQEIDLMNHPSYSPWRYITRSGKRPHRSISYWIDYPKTDSKFDREMRQWISKTIHLNMPQISENSELYVTWASKNMKDVLDYYSSRFFIGDSIEESHSDEYYFSGYEFKFLKNWESESCVTYLLSSAEDYPVNSWMSPTVWSRYITFDKQTGTEINEKNIFIDGQNEKINGIIWDALKKNLWEYLHVDIDNNPYFSEDDAKEEYESVLDYLGGNDDFEWERELSTIALSPKGVIVHYQTKARVGTLFMIPYEKIKPYLTVSMGEDGKDVFLESVQRASEKAKTIYQEDFHKNYIPNEQLLTTIEKEQGEESGEYLLMLSKMAEVYHLAENTELAVAFRQKYLDIVERLIGNQNNAWETNAQRQLRDLLTEKDYSKACMICDKLSKTWPEDEDAPFDDYEKEAKYDQMLMAAEAYYMTGNLQKAISVCKQSLQFIKSDVQRLTGITQMSRYQYKLNGKDSCMTYVSQVLYELQGFIIEKFQEYTAIQRKELWDKFRPWYCEFIPQMIYEMGDDFNLSFSYDAVMFGKGLLLNTENSLRQALINSGNPELLMKYELLNEQKKELNRIRSKRMDPDEKAKLTDEILEKIRDTERQLIQGSMLYNDFTKKIRINTRHLYDVLQDHEMTIEFCLINGDYYALLFKRSIPELSMVKLCSEEQLTRDEDIYASIWAPLEEYLQDITDIYFSPDGKLYNIGIEYACLPSEDKTLINEKYRIHRLSSTRELVVARNKDYYHPKAEESAILYGGIDYDVESRDIETEDTELTYRSAFNLRSLDRGSVNTLPYLPGTKKEIEMIGKTLQEASTPILVTTLTKRNATETSFKQLSGKKNRIIHLATHGFYITKKQANQMSGHSVINISNINDSYVEDRELLRSGLLMAGAMSEEKDKTIDDGILTALEVASMDLSSTELIVLSACETALGDVSSEGVFGLQRGFKKAGVQSLLMSLWKVDDTATQILMTEFYKGLTLGQSKREALLNAQKYLRQYQNGKYDKPEYWAAFILLD